jgi:hypothetical protein
MKHDGTARLGASHKSRRLAPKKGDNRHAFLQAGLEALLLRKFQNQIDGERLIRESASFANLLTQCQYIGCP